MNGQTTVNQPTNNNEQSIGKFHVVNVDKASTNLINNHDEASLAGGGQQHHPPTSVPVPTTTADESACGSRFQMIRVDRNFARGRWKVNDYEPPENVSNAANPPVNITENDPVNISNASTLSTVPTAMTATTPTNISSALPIDSNSTISAKIAATAAAVAAPIATAFQQQQQLLALNNPAPIVPTATMPPPNSLLHPYPPAALANLAAQNQPYLLQNHPQFGYYPFYPPPPYSHYAAQWAALAANPFLPPPQMPPPQQQPSQLPTGNLGDPTRHIDSDAIGENPFLSSLADHLQSAHMAATNPTSLMFASAHPHSAYLSQAPPTSVSPYATIASYHPAPSLPTIIPPLAQPLSLAQVIANNTTDTQQQLSHQASAPLLTSPKHEAAPTKTSLQPSNLPKTTSATPVPTKSTAINGANTDTSKTIATNPTQINDLLSSSPLIAVSQQLPPSLLSPMTVPTANANKAPTASLTDIWSLTSANSPLSLSQTVAQASAATAVAAMSLLNNNAGKNTEMTNDILKELTTPTKQNNTTDIDNKISAAMDLVKMHLLSAVREEVTELRQQIRILNEKVTNVEHENAFLRQHVPSEIYAQYTPLPVGLPATNDSSNSTTTATTTASTVPVPSSQPIPMASLSSLPASLAQQPPSSTTPQPPPPPASINPPPI